MGAGGYSICVGTACYVSAASGLCEEEGAGMWKLWRAEQFAGDSGGELPFPILPACQCPAFSSFENLSPVSFCLFPVLSFSSTGYKPLNKAMANAIYLNSCKLKPASN
jgi:hypothetical protein